MIDFGTYILFTYQVYETNWKQSMEDSKHCCYYLDLSFCDGYWEHQEGLSAARCVT